MCGIVWCVEFGIFDIMLRMWLLIIVIYNSVVFFCWYWFVECLVNVEWVVVDNGFIDDSIEIVIVFGVIVIVVEINFGFSVVNNCGF